MSALCPAKGAPLARVRGVEQIFEYSGIDPLGSCARAISSARPDIVIPCDDRGVLHLHELHQGASADVRELLEQSLGPQATFATIAKRERILSIAREEGVRVPDTGRVDSPGDLVAWQKTHSYPCVLKSDGTFGGRGVRIVEDLLAAERAFQELRNEFAAIRTAKRYLVNRDAFWLRPFWRHVVPSIIVQDMIDGHPANCGVVCWRGKVLAGIAVEVVATTTPTGPSSIVQVVDSTEMIGAAGKIVARLGLTGFIGLDFIIEHKSATPYLIEMNARCTPICAVQLGEGRDLVSALVSQLSGHFVQPVKVTDNSLISFFPQADESKLCAAGAFYDVPDGEPDLVKELLSPWPERTVTFRFLNRLTEFFVSPKESCPASSEAVPINASSRK